MCKFIAVLFQQITTRSANHSRRFATYGEIAREIPDGYKDPADPDKGADSGAGNVADEYDWPPIFEAMWYRVVLDEAHAIKNKASKGSCFEPWRRE